MVLGQQYHLYHLEIILLNVVHMSIEEDYLVDSCLYFNNHKYLGHACHIIWLRNSIKYIILV